MAVLAPPATCATTPCPVTPPARADVAYLPAALGTYGSGSTVNRVEDKSPPKTRAKIDHSSVDNGREGMNCSDGVEASDCETRPVELCLDQGAWLNEACGKYGQSSPSDILARLIDRANGEPPKMKRIIFLVVRCRRCLQHSRGGDKLEHQFKLSKLHWQWLGGVRDRCHHSSVAKTLRIIVDFYMQLCSDDPAFEQALVTRRPLDAIGE